MERTTERINIPFLAEPALKATYENGYTLVFVPKRGGVFNISTWIKTGSIHEDDQINGISHFLEHLLFKGTDRFQPGEFDRMMESMGAIINAATWKDFTFYYVTGPKVESNGNGKAKNAKAALDENFARALDMHSDMMLHSTIPEAEVGPPYNPEDPDYKGEKRERSVVIEEIGMREDQPWTKIYNAVNNMMYPDGHPYQRDVIGTRQIVATVPRETIVKYYRTWYSPHNFTTIVVGDFDFETLEPKILEAFDFGKIRPHDFIEGQALETAPEPELNGKRFEKILGQYNTSFFITGFHGPRPQDLEENIALDVVSYVLGEGRSSRLTQALVEKPAKPDFTMIGCSQSTFKLGNVFFIQGNFISKDDTAALGKVRAEIDKMLGKEPITEEEFQRALKKLKVEFAETSETASSLAEAIGESITVVGDVSYFTHYPEALSKMTLDKVNAAAKKYLAADKAYTSVLVPEEAVAVAT